MRKLLIATFVLAVAVALTARPALAKSHSFTLLQKGKLNGVELSPGAYKLEVGANGEATVYGDGKLVTKVSVEVKPRTDGNYQTIATYDADGNLREVRTGGKVFLFGSSSTAEGSRP